MAANKIKGLTITINGDTTGLDKALSGVNKKSKDLQSELREVEKLLKLDPGNTELLAQKQGLLADSVQSAKEKLDTLKTAAEQAQDKLANGEIGDDQFRALQREVVKAGQNLESLKKKSKEFGSVFTQQIAEAGKKMEEFGGKVSGAGTALTKGVTAPIVGIAAAAQVAFNEIDPALDTIVTKTGASGEALDGLNKSFKDVYGTMPVDAQKAGDAIGEVNTQFGLTGDALSKAAEQMIKFSEINGQDVSAAAIESKNAIEAFELSADNLDSVLDAVTKTAQNTGVGTDKLFDSVVRGAPQLKSLGLDFAESTALMGSFEQKGVDSSKALSYLSKAQVTFAKDGKTLTEGLGGLMDKIQSSTSETDKLTLASEAFGTKGATFMLDAIERGALSLSDFDGAAQSAAGSVSDTFEGTLDPVDKATVAMNNLKLAGSDLSSVIQDTLAPILDKIVEKVREFTEWFSSLSEGTRKTIVTIAGIVAVVGPALVVIGTVIEKAGVILELLPKIKGAITAVNAAIAANPIGAAIAVIAILVTALITLWNTNEDFRNAVIEIWENIKSSVGAAIESIKTFFTETIPGAIETMVTFFAGLPGRIWEALLNAIAKIQEWGANIKAWAEEYLPTPIATIVGFFAELPGKLLEIGANMVKGLWDGIWSKIEWVKGKVTGFVDMIKGWFTGKEGFDTHSPSKWSEKVFGNVMNGAVNGINGGVSGAINAAKDAVSAIKNVFSGAQNIPVSYQVDASGLTQATDSISALDSLRALGGQVQYAISTPAMTQGEQQEEMLQMVSDAVGTSLLAGLEAIANNIFEALPDVLQFYFDTRKVAETTFDANDAAATRRGRMYAPTRSQIEAIARSVMPKSTS